MQVAKHKVVSMDYTLTDAKGEVIDQSRPGQPLVYLHGTGGIIPGLEKELEGKSAGDSVKAVVPPEEAYGVKQQELIQAVPRAAFQGVPKIEPGMKFQAQTQQGPRVVTVVEATADTVTVDANHELAGATLYFDVKIADVRDATPEEISHGHVHGPGGHHHH
jgi:FKBP-type peptidyl-prolyl cis-trans isomerase SlyD